MSAGTTNVVSAGTIKREAETEATADIATPASELENL